MDHIKERMAIAFLPYFKIVALCSLIYGPIIIYCRFFLADYEPRKLFPGLLILVSILALVLFVWKLNKRFRVFDNKKGTFGIGLIVIVGVFFNSLLLDDVLNKLFYKLRKVDDVTRISASPYHRYYSTENFKWARDTMFINFFSNVGGKNNRDLTYSCYALFPIRNASGKIPDTVNVWYGMSFSKKISNRESNEFKENARREFELSIYTEFNNVHPEDAVYFERAHSGNDLDRYVELLQHPEGMPSTEIVLEARTEPFNSRYNKSLLFLFISYLIPAFIIFLITAFTPILTDRFAAFRKRPESDLLYYPYERK